MSSVLICDNVYRSFSDSRNSFEILKGVTFTIKRGEVVGIVGPSGSGKTTLLHLVGGLDMPTAGRISFQELNKAKSTYKHPPIRPFQGLGFVFQNHYLVQDLTVIEKVALPGIIKGKAKMDRAKHLLQRVDLEGQMNASINTLSGGERQRVAVARAVYLAPRLIVADEPTGSLDKINAQRVITTLLDLAQSSGSAILIATHDERLANKIPRILELEDGKLVDP